MTLIELLEASKRRITEIQPWLWEDCFDQRAKCLIISEEGNHIATAVVCDDPSVEVWAVEIPGFAWWCSTEWRESYINAVVSRGLDLSGEELAESQILGILGEIE